MSLPERRIDALLLHDRFVRGLARKLLADRHAAEDVAQETWVAALEAGGAAASAPRWLAGVVKNLAHKALRGERNRGRREGVAARPEAVPSTGELLEREAARTRLVQAVFALEHSQRDVVVLRYFENLPPRVIAKRLGLPVETVRTRLKRALARLRERLDRECGGRETWGALLLPFARPVPISLGTASLLAMTSQAKLAVGVLVVALAALLFWEARRSSSVPQAAAPTTRPPTPLAESESPAPPLSIPPEPSVRVELPAAFPRTPDTLPLEATGSLLVRARWYDGSAASGVGVQVDSPSVALGTHSLHMREATTGSQGECRFEGLAPDRVLVVLERDLDGPTTTRIEARKEAVLELEIPRGFDVDGVVLDPFGRPVAGAEVWRFGWGAIESGFPVARTSADGGFEVRSCSTGSLGARAPGFAPSLLASAKAAEGAQLSLELVLMGPGGEVGGIVRDPEGEPVAGAFVLVAGGRIPIAQRVTETPVGGTGPIQGWSPGPIETRTDAEGVYRVQGVGLGLRPVAVRAEGFAIWRGEVEIFEHGSATLDVRLSPGVDVYGSVVDASGSPVRAEISAGTAFGLLGSQTTTAPDGTFELADLEPGEIALYAEGEQGRASTKLSGAAGDELFWDAVLVTGAAIRGRLVDESGLGLAGWSVEVEDDPIVGADASGAVIGFDHKNAQTDSEGRFVVEDCQERSHRVEAHAPGTWMFASAIVKGVFPAREELLVRVESARLPSVRIAGMVVDESGHGFGAAQLSPTNQEASGGVVLSSAVDGSFDFGPYPPGTLWLHVRADGFPDVFLGPHELEPNETWDCGEIVLRTGGTLLVTASRDAKTRQARPQFVVRQEARWRGRLHPEEDRWRSAALAPGAYQLVLRGEGIAARLVPFEIRPGETTEVQLALAEGLPAQIRVEAEDTGHRPLLRVLNPGGATLVEEELQPLKNGGFALDLSLVPGSYGVEASCAGQRALGTLVVAPGEAPSRLLLELR